ncbi:MAG: FemAB family PEP-CTERM system-associated protein [Gemmatimonas sp.]|nr:FemAB family PEP-CTERM system-associated protein [Gemmatimonas sp.]
MTSSVQLAGPAGLQVVRHDGDPAEWDRFVAESPEASYAHLAGWREVMTDTLGHESRYLVGVDAGGVWQGVLPLVHVRSRIFGSYLVSLPFVNYGGPLGSPSVQQELAVAALAEASRRGVDLLELRGGTMPYDGMGVSNRKATVLLDLQETAEAMWKWFPSKLRSQIRRAQKEEMEVRFGLSEVEPFYEVFSRNMRDLGTPVLPKQFFEKIASSLARQAVVGVVYLGTQPVAGGLGFVWRDRFEITWASSLREFNRKSPNMLLYWSFMEHVIGRGAKTFDFGRCTPGSNTHIFKLQWGGESEELPWTQWSANGVRSTPSPDRPIYRFATGAWSRLPLAVANRLGPVLSRQLP